MNVSEPFDPYHETLPRWLFYEATHLAGLALFTLGLSYRWEGQKNVPKTGPVLLVANHQSFLDPPLVGMAVRRHLVYLARKTLFKNPLFGALIRTLNAVPIDQEGVGKEGIRSITQQLGLGKAVLVFPEGTRTPDGTMQPLKPGIHLLMKKTDAPILPVGIAGAYEAWPLWQKLPHLSPLFLPPTRCTVAVSVGKALMPRDYAQFPREKALELLDGEIKQCQRRAEALRRR